MNAIPDGFNGTESHEQAFSMSTDISELSAALAQAQGQMHGARKGADNPFFKSKYADLAACWEACRDPLSNNGLSLIQIPVHTEGRAGLVTQLAHSSGQWIRGFMTMLPGKDDPQGVGSCLTYMRRYALASFVGLAQVDDDAESATYRMSKQKETKIVKAMEQAIEQEDQGALIQNWDELNSDEKKFIWSGLDRHRQKIWNDAIRAAQFALADDKPDPNYIEPAEVANG
jgi:hypothetical protein